MVHLENIRGMVECPSPFDLINFDNKSLINTQLPLFYSYFNSREFKQYLKSCSGSRDAISSRFFQELGLSPKDVVSVWRSYTPNQSGCSFQVIYPEKKFSFEKAKKLAEFLSYFAFPPEAPGLVDSIESDNAPVPYHFRITISILQS